MAGNEPPYLNVGTDVSAKYKGAFCEAKVKKVNRSVKVKVILKECHSSVIVTDDHIDGRLMLGATVVVKQPNNGQTSEGVINKLTDSSMYTVVFDDGDEATLRRSQLCLKGDKHFTESETLDNLPLSHPEHFGTPVLQKKTKKAANSGNETESEAESDTDESIPKRQTYKGRHQELVGKVMMYESTERRKGGTLAIPVLVVLPDAHDIDLRTKDHILVKSFKDNKFSSVLKKELKEFNRDMALKNEISALKNAFEKALTYFDSRDLPASWKKEDLLGSEEENDEDESSDDEQNEEKDRFVAQLYKFMDDRGTPINKGPSVGVHDLNLYRFFKIVQNLGGYNKVTNLDKWRVVYNKMSLPMSNSAGSQMKNAYKKYLHAFEDFYRKLGSTMGTLSRPGRQRNNSGRNIIPFRGREKETATQRLKKEEIDDSSSEKSKTAKSDDTSDTDSIFKDESDTETTVKRSVTRREKERLKEESKEQKPEREKRESTRGKTEEKKEEEEKRSTRRDKDEDKGSLKDEKISSKAEEKSEEKKKEENTKDDPIKKRITRRKSGRVDKSEKDEEEEEVEEKEPKKKGNNKMADKEEKKEEKKLTRKDMKDLKDKKALKEEKGGNKEEKNEKPSSVKQEDSGDEEEELSEKADDDEKRKHLPYGTKVKVKYGRGKNIKIYEAKVVEASKEAGQKTYLVHYAGWNNRYDEWIKRERIVSIVDRPDTKNSKKVTAVNVSPKSSLKQQLVSQIQKKRGRPTSGTPPPTKANEFRIPQTKLPCTANKGRPTRSNSLEMKVIDVLPPKMRTTRRSSGMTDNSDVQSRASDESYDTEDELETDEKPPNLSETNSAPKSPEQEEPESELETSMEEEAPELEAVKPIEELNLTSEDMTPPPTVVQVKEEDTKPTEEPVREEPVLEPITEKIVKETLKEKAVKEVKEKPKDVKEKPKDVKEKPKDVKEKPKEVKEKQKEVKEKPKEVKEKPKEIKEKPKEVKDKPKDIKEKPKEIKDKPKEVKEPKAKETRDVRRLLLPETKPAEVKSTSIYDFEDTEISDDFKIEEKRFEKKEPPTELDLDEILKAVLTPDSSKGDRVEEMKEELEREKQELERKRQELEKGKIQLEEMIKEDAKLDMKTPDEVEKKVKVKKKDLKDSAKKDTKDKQIKRGRPLLADMTGTPKQLDFSPISSPSPNSSLNLGKKALVFLAEETPEKIKKEAGDSKTKKEKKKDTVEKTPVGEGKISDTESKDVVDSTEKKKVKKKIKKKIFGENLNDSSEPLAFSDLTKDNLDKLKAEVKKEPKTPKSATKDKLTKPKDTKKSKEIENKDMIPLGTCALPDVSGDVMEEVNKIDRKDNKRVMSPSDIPMDFRSKVAKLDKSENLGETSFDPSILMPSNLCNKDSESKMSGGANMFRSALMSFANIVPDSETKNSAVNMVIDNTPPRTPEHQRNEQKSFDTVNVPLVKEVAMKSGEDNSTACNGGDHVSNSGGESPTAGGNSVTSTEGMESSVVPSSESSNDVEVGTVKRKRETEDPSPTKKTKRRSSNKNSRGSERNKNKFTGSDSEDTNSCKLSSPSHTPASPLKQPEQVRSPRPSKYNFINLEEAHLLEGEKKIEFITDRMKQLRTLYFQLKAEVAAIDKKRKRARRKERDNSQSSHLDNESS